MDIVSIMRKQFYHCSVWITPEVLWVCELPVNCVAFEDSIEVSITRRGVQEKLP